MLRPDNRPVLYHSSRLLQNPNRVGPTILQARCREEEQGGLEVLALDHLHCHRSVLGAHGHLLYENTYKNLKILTVFLADFPLLHLCPVFAYMWYGFLCACIFGCYNINLPNIELRNIGLVVRRWVF